MNADQPSSADQRWIEAMFADVQRQLNDLTAQLQALTRLVHAHTIATLDSRPATASPPEPDPGSGSDPRVDVDDGQP